MSEPSDQDWMYDELANLGYPCFGHYRKGPASCTPERFLAHVLDMADVKARIVEALPWLVYASPLMEWAWLIEEMRRRDRQNRLGFLVDLAIALAAALGEADRVQQLLPQRDLLNMIKLDREDTLCHLYRTEAMLNQRRDGRSATAASWNIVSDIHLKHLHYTPQYDENMKSCEAVVPETGLHDTLKFFEVRCLKRPNHRREHLSLSRAGHDGDLTSTDRPKKQWVDRDDPEDFAS